MQIILVAYKLWLVAKITHWRPNGSRH